MKNQHALPRDLLLKMYRQMVQIRSFELEAIELAKRNLTRAAIHTCNGEEAIAVGIMSNLRQDDCIFSYHRGHGHCIAKGANPRFMFAELMARNTGYCHGKGGSMHIADIEHGILGANGIVGAQMPLATGAALGILHQGQDRIVICFFGDGASNEGAFHEAVNLASVWKLPVIFLCINNQYGISMPIDKAINVGNISERAHSYGIPGYSLDGNQVDVVYAEMKQIVKSVRAGNGPALVEMKTYRMSGHYFGDNENYRSREEVRQWAEKDAIQYCAELLKRDYNIAEGVLRQIQEEESAYILKMSELARQDAFPSEDSLTTDVYDPTFAKISWRAWPAERN